MQADRFHSIACDLLDSEQIAGFQVSIDGTKESSTQSSQGGPQSNAFGCEDAIGSYDEELGEAMSRILAYGRIRRAQVNGLEATVGHFPSALVAPDLGGQGMEIGRPASDVGSRPQVIGADSTPFCFHFRVFAVEFVEVVAGQGKEDLPILRESTVPLFEIVDAAPHGSLVDAAEVVHADRPGPLVEPLVVWIQDNRRVEVSVQICVAAHSSDLPAEVQNCLGPDEVGDCFVISQTHDLEDVCRG